MHTVFASTTNDVPILSTVPRSGTWFLRYSISFLCHLDRGGRIDDRLTGRVIGNPSGQHFDFQSFKGGPLFCVQGTMPVDHLFVGHTVCPGFAAMAGEVDWWKRTLFHVPGYDYLHEGMNYRYTPVELARFPYAPIDVSSLERATNKRRGPQVVLVHRNPLDQAASYYQYCQTHKNAAYNRLNGRALGSISFDDYLFGSALPSYAKQFISFQIMASRYPRRVRLVSYESLMAEPAEVMMTVLDHLSGRAQLRPALRDAVWLARSEHMKAIERELGRSLDGTRIGHHSHIRKPEVRQLDIDRQGSRRRRVLNILRQMGVDTDLIEWPAANRLCA
jgi:Sulfotransferase domain